MTPIKITDNAAKQIENLLTKAPEGSKGVRLTVKSTGCSGNSYKMEYIKADESLEGDEKFVDAGATLYIPKIYSWMLFGLTVDHVSDNLGNSKFEFINPNETARCGCGESFQVEKKKS